jgi:hypothetical protein
MSEITDNKPLKKTERMELLKKQLEELEKEEEQESEPEQEPEQDNIIEKPTNSLNFFNGFPGYFIKIFTYNNIVMALRLHRDIGKNKLLYGRYKLLLTR